MNDDDEIRHRGLVMARTEEFRAREQQERATAALLSKALEPRGTPPATTATSDRATTSARRDELVKLARAALSKADPTEHCANPATYQPPAWILEAMQRAYEAGLGDGATLEREMPF